jgi:hypothetical protein
VGGLRPVVAAARGGGGTLWRPVVAAARGGGGPWRRRHVVAARRGGGTLWRPVVAAARGGGGPWWRRPVVAGGGDVPWVHQTGRQLRFGGPFVDRAMGALIEFGVVYLTHKVG